MGWFDITRNIVCKACGFEGKIEAHDTIGTVPANKIFKHLGKDSATGYLMFLCPSCTRHLAVDPLKALFTRKMKGHPAQQTRYGEIDIDVHLEAQRHLNKGSYFLKKGNLDSAISEFQEAIRLKPDYAEAHVGLGAVYGEKGLYDQAIRHFEQAALIKSDLIEAYIGEERKWN